MVGGGVTKIVPLKKNLNEKHTQEKLLVEDLREIAALHARCPHALDNIQLLGGMPPEDGEPFGFVRSVELSTQMADALRKWLRE
jgi:hypothetical protein